MTSTLSLTEWLCEKWGLEKQIDSPYYVVGLGSGIQNTDEGELTQAGKNVVDKCFSLYQSHRDAYGIILVGGRAWDTPPIMDVTLMHQRLLKLGQSVESLTIPSENIVILEGNNTYEQIRALWGFISHSAQVRVLIVCPRLQSRRLRAILKKRGLLERAGIQQVEDGCEPGTPVEKFRWSKRRYLVREVLACLHHRIHGWI